MPTFQPQNNVLYIFKHFYIFNINYMLFEITFEITR